jgi:hypothetical protein
VNLNSLKNRFYFLYYERVDSVDCFCLAIVLAVTEAGQWESSKRSAHDFVTSPFGPRRSIDDKNKRNGQATIGQFVSESVTSAAKF